MGRAPSLTGSRARSPVAITIGDPRGIGPEVTLKAIRILREEGDPGDFVLLAPGPVPIPDALADLRIPGWDGTSGGAGRISAEAIRTGVRMALDGEVSALITGPIHKPALHEAGVRVPGQTEFLQALTGAPAVGMLMAAETTRIGPPLRVLLATTHLPLRDVPLTLTAERLIEQARLLEEGLRRGWGIPAPRIALCAFNPHASDGGLFGDEEARVYAPAIAGLRSDGIAVSDPIPADTVFLRTLRGEFDAVIAPYHDVGMAPFKTVAFGGGVNVTLGLPFPRTSPDHGTAFDRAGRGEGDPSSTVAAIRLARKLAAGFDTPSAPL